MRSLVKNLLKKTAPAILAASAAAASAADHPATQPAPPATQPSPQLRAQTACAPLVIPDGTSGPVSPARMNDEMMDISGARW